MIDPVLLNETIENGWVQVQKHPEKDLFIYNYTQKTQFERVWNDITLKCRGLILDEAYNIIAHPFPKFFNLGEMENQHIPNEDFEVFEKMDGSLGILYWSENQPFIASRGSFASKQAKKATDILYEKYQSIFHLLDPSKTYLFEIIYPENRIVVDYGVTEDLVLLAVVDTQTGKDVPLPKIGFPIVKKYSGIKEIHTLKQLSQANKEGFVIRYENGLRYKVKFEEYLRIHRIITQVSSINIWEYLVAEMPFNELLEKVPDEFFQWVRKTAENLKTAFLQMENQAKKDFKVLDTQKETALYFQTCENTAVLFAMLNNRDYKKIIWKKLRPEFQKPFSNLEEI